MAAASNTATEVAQRCNSCQGKKFLKSVGHSIFILNAAATLKKNDDGVEEDNEKDNESGISDGDIDEEGGVVENIEDNESQPHEEFFP